MNYWDDESIVRRFFTKVDKKGDDECWLWKASISAGYGQFTISPMMHKAHRVSFEIHHKRLIGEGLCILHSCDNPKCVNPHHLREGTHAENMDDRQRRNRCAAQKGETNGASKLTADQVREIRKRYAEKTCFQKELADEYNVTFQLISRIVTNKLWKHVS